MTVPTYGSKNGITTEGVLSQTGGGLSPVVVEDSGDV